MVPHLQRRRWLAACIALALAGPFGGGGPARAADPLKITYTDHHDPLSALSEAVLRRAYRELGVAVEFVAVPSRRGFEMLLAGAVDGNAHRVAELAAEQPALVRVDPPVSYSEIRVYGRQDGLAAIGGWSALAGRRVIHQRGVLAIERRLPTAAQRVEANDNVDCFRHLKAGIGELVVIVEPRGSVTDRMLPAGYHRLDGILESIPLHHYLHVRHRALAGRLGEVIRRLEAAGELNQIRQKLLAEQR